MVGQGKRVRGHLPPARCLDLEDAVVTIDSAGCQMTIAWQLRVARAGGAVKRDPPLVHVEETTAFKDEERGAFRPGGEGPRQDS